MLSFALLFHASIASFFLISSADLAKQSIHQHRHSPQLLTIMLLPPQKGHLFTMIPLIAIAVTASLFVFVFQQLGMPDLFAYQTAAVFAENTDRELLGYGCMQTEQRFTMNSERQDQRLVI